MFCVSRTFKVPSIIKFPLIAISELKEASPSTMRLDERLVVSLTRNVEFNETSSATIKPAFNDKSLFTLIPMPPSIADIGIVSFGY